MIYSFYSLNCDYTILAVSDRYTDDLGEETDVVNVCKGLLDDIRAEEKSCFILKIS